MDRRRFSVKECDGVRVSVCVRMCVREWRREKAGDKPAHTLVKPYKKKEKKIAGQVISTRTLCSAFSLSCSRALDSWRESVERKLKATILIVLLLCAWLPARLPACLPACVPWAMFMLCPAQDRIDSPTQHCAFNQNLSRSGKPEPQSHSLSLLWIRPYGPGATQWWLH